MSRRPPKPPFWTAGPCVCRLCGERVAGRGQKARWHLHCLSEYAPVVSPRSVRGIAHEASEGRCGQCGKHHDLDARTWEADHRKPLWRANGDIKYWLRQNLQVLCVEPCHAAKSAKDAAEYRVSQRGRSR